MTVGRLERGGDEGLEGCTLEGRYRVEKQIASRANSTVYLCTDLHDFGTVAVKVLEPVSAQSEQTIERFKRQARALRELAHPNVVELYEFGCDGARDAMYVVTEFVHGTRLASLLRLGAWRPQAVCKVGIQLASALDAAHQNGIVHRNLEPGNVILGRPSTASVAGVRATLVGFGIARFGTGESEVTHHGEIPGEPQYAAPERITEGTDGPQADLYGLGALLFQMVSGKPLFSGASRVQVLYKQAHVDPPDLAELAPAEDVPERLVRLVGAMLEKKPGERPDSAASIRTNLESILDELEPIPAVRRERDYTRWFVEDLDSKDLLVEVTGRSRGTDRRRTRSVPMMPGGGDTRATRMMTNVGEKVDLSRLQREAGEEKTGATETRTGSCRTTSATRDLPDVPPPDRRDDEHRTPPPDRRDDEHRTPRPVSSAEDGPERLGGSADSGAGRVSSTVRPRDWVLAVFWLLLCTALGLGFAVAVVSW